MKVAFYIAKRYLLSKKSTNVINIISGISVAGVTLVTMALIVILSIINGFNNLLEQLYSSFDPDIKITVVEGKTFTPTGESFEQIKRIDGIIYFGEVVEENVLLRYDEQEYIATVKGVGDEFAQRTGIDSMIIEGDFLLNYKKQNFAIIGLGVKYFLSVGLNFISPIKVYAPRKGIKGSLSPEKAFNKKMIFPSGVFSIQQDFDEKYIIVPIEFARDLLDYTNEVSAVELKLANNADKESIQNQIQAILGSNYAVKNQYEQHEFIYKIMKSEKWVIFLILAFILLIASFNIIGSLTMLIIDKRKDIATLQSMGANLTLIRNVFLIEGWLISIIGAIAGLFIGAIFCWLQVEFGIVKLQGSGTFIIDSYPVEIQLSDFIIVFLAVISIGFVAAWYPVRYLTKKYLIYT